MLLEKEVALQKVVNQPESYTMDELDRFESQCWPCDDLSPQTDQ